MSHSPVSLNELAKAVQNAVQQTLAKHGAVPIDQLWVGFVAPEAIANAESAREVAHALSKEAGIKGEPSVGQFGGGATGATEAHALPHRIIGLIYKPQLAQK